MCVVSHLHNLDGQNKYILLTHILSRLYHVSVSLIAISVDNLFELRPEEYHGSL